MGNSLIAIGRAAKSPSSLFVTWTLHNRCNYRCSYCPDGLNDGTTCSVTADDVISFADRVLVQAKRSQINRWTFAFSGGEPTFFPDFPRLLRELYQRGIDTTFTSNGSRPLEWWREVWDYFDHCVLSYHPEFARDDRFVDKVRELSQHVLLNVDFMMTVAGFDHCREVAAQLNGLPNINIQFLPIQRDFGGHGGGLVQYTDEQLELLRSQSSYEGAVSGEVRERRNRRGGFGRGIQLATWLRDGVTQRERLDYRLVVARDDNRFLGWTCFAGIESLIVDMYGDVYRAYCLEGGKIGNVRDGVAPPEAPIVCTHERCTCSVDIEVSKHAHAAT
jgi:organic radical activating enzyme